METTIWFWIAFNAFVLAMLALDLGVFHRTAHAVTMREAGIWSAAWVALALLFNAGLYLVWGPEPALQFLTGYVIEKSLSLDNIFVFVMLFSFFAIPAKSQHRVLVWGILGALAMRGLFIAAGSYVLQQFHWVMYVFGAVLVLTGIRMVRRIGTHDLSHSPMLRLAQRILPVTSRLDGERFWTREHGRRVATPLFLTLLFVEASDLLFAIDSIPAIFAVTREPFLVYTANAFAILGLRSMYFLLAGVVDRFVHLKYGLAAVLVFVGAKMSLANVVEVPVALSLAVIAVLIGGSVAASLLVGRYRPDARRREMPNITRAPPPSSRRTRSSRRP